MADTNIGIIITAKDLTSGALNSVRSSLGRVSAALTSVKGVLAGIGIAAAGKSILSTASSFEQMNVSMTTVLGSSEKASEAMDWITDFTAKTPYQLEDVTQGFIKMSSYGLDATKNLEWIGNTASAMGKSLDSAVEAVADAVTGEFERLKEFGVKAKQEGNSVTFSWNKNGEQLTKTVSKTSEDITTALGEIFSRFDGGMEAQSTTMSGILSNIGDSWDAFVLKLADSGAFEGVKAGLAVIQEKMKTWSEDGTTDKIAEKFATFAEVLARVVEGVVLTIGGITVAVQAVITVFGGLGTAVNLAFSAALVVIEKVLTVFSKIADAISRVLSLFGMDSEAKMFEGMAAEMASTAAEAAKWSKVYKDAADDAMQFVKDMAETIKSTIENLKTIHATFNEILAAMVATHGKAHDEMVKKSAEAHLKTKESLMQMMADIKDAGLSDGVSITFKDGTFSTSKAKGYADGGVVPGGFRAFANGGVVTEPTLGLIGEGNYNEAVVPLPDGRSIPVEFKNTSEEKAYVPYNQTYSVLTSLTSSLSSAINDSFNYVVEKTKESYESTKEIIVRAVIDVQPLTFKDGTFPSLKAKGSADGGIIPGGFRAFANGGVVTEPTLGLIGEGRCNEAVVPLPDGRSIPVEFINTSEDRAYVSYNQINSVLTSLTSSLFSAVNDSLNYVVEKTKESYESTKEIIVRAVIDVQPLTFKDGTFPSSKAKGSADGGVVPGGFKAFANGGVVTEPTLGLIGEGRCNEAVVPLPDGRSIPAEFGGTIINLSVNISTLDSKSFEQYIKANPKAIIDLFVDGLKYGGDIKTAVKRVK